MRMFVEIKVLVVLIAILLLGCSEPLEIRKDYTVIPKKSTIFFVEDGIKPEHLSEKVVFEKYTETRLGTVTVFRLYESGVCYDIYLSAEDSVEDTGIKWNELKALSPSEFEKIEEISQNQVIKYLNNGPYKVKNGPNANVAWYFYFNTPIFARTQVNHRWLFFSKPTFARKIDRILGKHQQL